ncbi:hypothetical protein [Pyrobaculum aerophilum]|uniref:hypothetical protein n=1 Tax=Pyrobaculum aerophilum TaxID=13773 RepID=UPI0023F07360|nr:hypothetical protein [Pyrobaculum aerophilum]MCX8136074.1 hypothetical protein [Pyrobaculum aerophilum]
MSLLEGVAVGELLFCMIPQLDAAVGSAQAVQLAIGSVRGILQLGSARPLEGDV